MELAVFASERVSVHQAALQAVRHGEQQILRSLESLRRVVGPHASSAELWKYLRRFSHDVRNATNGYLRSACATDEPRFDFHPRLARASAVAGSATASSESRGVAEGCRRWVPWLELEPHLFPAVSHLALTDCGPLLAVSPGLWSKVACDDALWVSALAQVFGVPHCPEILRRLEATSASLRVCAPGSRKSVLAVPQPRAAHALPRPAAGNGSRLATAGRGRGSSAFAHFVQRWVQERWRTCPECGAIEAVTPVVCGFPSPQLAAHHRTGSLVLTENCGVMGPPWVCRRCHVEWEEYPFAPTSKPIGRVDSLASPVAGAALQAPLDPVTETLGAEELAVYD
mmetsp:Transcript_35963/g.99085  ORF Transcript_35963/g.99085 Transcript_35963/m.99085 type:complete len:341 (-) Transcript_35963:145-1167(-)